MIKIVLVFTLFRKHLEKNKVKKQILYRMQEKALKGLVISLM